MSPPETGELRIVVVDDEPLARRLLRDVVEETEAASVVAECADGREALEALRRGPADLVLLDVQMPGQGGFDVIEAIGADAMPEVIFVTAHEQYTLQAFEVHALDYVVKPVDPSRLAEALEHARRRILAGRGDSLRRRLEALLEERASPGHARQATVRKGDRILFIPFDSVDWIEAARNYVRLHRGDESYLLRSPLKGLLARLDPRRFVRIHRSAAVNLDRVAEVEPRGGGDYVVRLEDGQRLRASRTYADRLLRGVH